MDSKNLSRIKIGILTVSDRAHRGEYHDLSGPSIHEYFTAQLKNEIEFEYIIVPDSYTDIKNSIIRLCDKLECSLVITTGGTGPSSRDITPEATVAACHRILPGFGEMMRSESLRYVPTAILSRQTAGVRGNSLIINLPGSPKAIKQCLDAVLAAIPDCLKIIGGPILELRFGASPIFH